MNQKKSPPNYHWVSTEDGSQTLFSERFQEACHSTSGARSETLLHYIHGCKIPEKSSAKEMTILEVGFGLGLGFLTTLEVLKNSPHQFHFVSLEIDEGLVRWFVEEHKTLLQNIQWTELSLKARHENGTLEVLIGDARQILPPYSSLQWDAIYQDAFSPKKNPSLWTVEWFELLKKHSAQDVLMSTYSASSSIRKSMIAAGWKIHKGEKFGPKRTSTRASLTGETDFDISEHLARSPSPALTDANMEQYGK